MSLIKGPVFSAKNERFTTYGTEIGTENRPFLSSRKRNLKNFFPSSMVSEVLAV